MQTMIDPSDFDVLETSDTVFSFENTVRDEDELMAALYKARDTVLAMWDADIEMVDLEITVSKG